MNKITRKSLLLLVATISSCLFADYATEYRDLYYKWKAADDAFKVYTKNLQETEPSEELKKKAEDLGIEFHQAKRTHPALSDQNTVIDGLQEELATAITEGDYAQKAVIQKEINAAMHKLGELAKKVPDLVDLEHTYIQAMLAANESKWAFDPKALELFREVEKLRRDLADLRASSGQ